MMSVLVGGVGWEREGRLDMSSERAGRDDVEEDREAREAPKEGEEGNDPGGDTVIPFILEDWRLKRRGRLELLERREKSCRGRRRRRRRKSEEDQVAVR